jgi:hypothetical protein
MKGGLALLVLGCLSNCFGQVVELGGVLFDADFDGGSIGVLRFQESDGTWIMELPADNGDTSLPDSFRRTFHFRCAGVAGKRMAIRLTGVYWQAGNIPLARFADGPFFRLSDNGSGDEWLILDVPPEEDQVWFAYTHPYGVADKQAWLRSLAATPHLKVEELGRLPVPNDVDPSVGALELLTIAEPGSNPKGSIWLHARIHPGEIPPSFVVEGLVEALLGNHPRLLELKRTFNLYIVPMANPLGVYQGNYRTNHQSRNLESAWCGAPAPGDVPADAELALLKERIDQIQRGPAPLILALNLHSTMTFSKEGHFHFKHLQPSVSATFEKRQQNWIRLFEEAASQFNDVNPQSSQLNSCAFVESYLWNHWGESVMALTFETTYLTRDSDDAFAEPKDFRQLGREMAQAMADFVLGTPSLIPPAADEESVLFIHARRHGSDLEGPGLNSQLEPYGALTVANSDLPFFSTAGRVSALHLQQRGLGRALLPLAGELSEAWLVPHVAAAPWTSELVLSNPHAQAVQLIMPSGQSGLLPPSSSLSFRLDPTGSGFPEISADKAIQASLIYDLNGEIAAGVPLQKPAKQVFLPHIPTDQGRWWLGTVWTNPHGETQHILVEGFGEGGSLLGSTTLELPAHSKLVQRFDLEMASLKGSRWLRCSAELPIHGFLLFGTWPFEAMAGLPFFTNSHHYLACPVLLGRDPVHWQAIALLNPGDGHATITLSIFSPGLTAQPFQLQLPPLSNRTLDLSSVVPAGATWLHLSSDQPVIGLSLISGLDFTWFEGFPLAPDENLPREVPKRKMVER